MKKVLKLLLDFIFPLSCLGCGASGELVCDKCAEQIKERSEQRCPECGRASEFGRFCSERCRNGYWFEGLIVLGEYEGNFLLAKVIHIFKYRFCRDLGGWLGRLLAGSGVPDGFNFVVPVPLSRERMTFRGFNQSLILAEELARIRGMKVMNFLERSHRLEQAKLSGVERRRNLIGSVRVGGPERVARGRRFLVVDDVATTCSTINECARALKQAGAVEVWGLVLARA